MAFVSTDHQLVFIHITKNGGTSVCSSLSRLHQSQLTGKRDFNHDGVGNNIAKRFRPSGINVHDTWDQVKEKFPEAANYHAFAIARNPWARLFSYYQHKVRRGDADLPMRNGQPLPFAECFRVSNILLLQPQTWWIGADQNVALLRHEHLNKDYKALMEALGIDAPALPRLNRSKSSGSYAEAYDDFARDLIWHYYRHEIDLWGYEFGG